MKDIEAERRLQYLFSSDAPIIVRDNGLLNSSFPKWVRNRKAEYKKLLEATAFLTEGATIAQRLWHLYYEIEDIPSCVCGTALPFYSFTEGYRTYCSAACRKKYSHRAARATYREKYGVEHPMQRQDIKDKVATTTQERYGASNYFSSEEFKHRVASGDITRDYDAVQEKMRATNLKRYGVKHPMQSDSHKRKVAATNLDRYGHTCSLHGPAIQHKIQRNRAEAFYTDILQGAKYHKPLFTREQYTGTLDEHGQVLLYPWECSVCGTTFDDYIANGKLPRCPSCYPTDDSRGTVERELVEWLREEFPTLNFVSTRRLVQSDRGRLEIDIYCESEAFAIELDELAWHGEVGCRREGTGRNRRYHVQKTDALREKGIRLLHIWDIEWLGKKHIVKSIIRRYLGKYSRTIYARKCIIGDVDAHTARAFLDINHLQGYAPGRIQKGLYFEGELVAMISLASNRFRRNTWEVVRYVVKADTNVPGGYSKALKAAEKQLQENTLLVSYVDRRWFTGESNIHAGFRLTNTRKPSYHYTKDYKQLFNRMSFQKKKLAAKLAEYDPTKTEWENMQINGWDRVWDCGTFVYEKLVNAT